MKWLDSTAAVFVCGSVGAGAFTIHRPNPSRGGAFEPAGAVGIWGLGIDPVSAVSFSPSSLSSSILDEPIGEGKPHPPADAPSYPYPPGSVVAGTELWLDLRGTAIAPRAALSHLTDDLLGDYAPPSGRARLVDRVLVSGDGVARALQYIDDGVYLDVFFIRDEDGAILDARDETVMVGSVITLEEGVATDPLPALDAVSSGRWIVVDSDGIREEALRGEAVNGLVEFLSAGASASGGLLIGAREPLLGKGDVVGSVGGSIGGIAVSCKTKGDVLRSAAYVQSMGPGGSFITTESGIIVQQQNDDVDIVPSGGEAPYKSAIIIPFDADLWKAASFVFGDFSE